MRSWLLAIFFAAIVLDSLSRLAFAGMPTITLSDIARMRLQTISFFLLVLLISSLGIQRIWNSFTTDFPKLPRLSFGKALGVVILWGLLFIIVLTMISGARELMTPGAWEKQGLTYRLKEAPPAKAQPTDEEQLRQQRQSNLERLGIGLIQFAIEHDGRYPDESEKDQITEERWQHPDQVGIRYLYRPGLSIADGESLLAFEADIYDDEQLVLLANGKVKSLGSSEIRKKLGLEVGHD